VNYDTTQALAVIGALIKKLVVPSAGALANRATAAAFQRVLEPLESNADPNNPGLVEIFQQVNANIAALREAGANDTASLLQLKRWTHDAYTCYEALQYLLRSARFRPSQCRAVRGLFHRSRRLPQHQPHLPVARRRPQRHQAEHRWAGRFRFQPPLFRRCGCLPN
jgi:hypothetical protein